MTDPLDTVAADTIASAPAPSENAIEAEEGKARETERATAGLVDRDGFPFDPDVHRTGIDGEPLLSPRGKLQRKPGRKPNANLGAQKSTLNIPKGGSQTAPDGAPSPDSAMVAAYTVDFVQTVGLMVGGEEWEFKQDAKTGVDERAHGVMAFTRYYEANGIVDLPPGIALAAWGVAYAMPRIVAGPKTKTRLQLAWAWAKTRIFKRRPNAHADNRPNGERQDNASGAIIREVPASGVESRSAGPVAR